MLKIRFIFALFAGMLLLAQCARKTTPSTGVPIDFYGAINIPNPGYDSILSQKLNAGDYGMQQYVMAFLKKGPNRSQDSITAANLQRAHMENIGRMAESGKLVMAGPFMDDGDIRGIYIFNVRTVEEARQLTATDPAIQAGRLEMELHPWYGSAALPLLVPLHNRLQKPKKSK